MTKAQIRAVCAESGVEPPEPTPEEKYARRKKQLEDFLAAHPKIHDVAVIGLPDQRLGEIAAAVIQVKEGMTLTEDEVNRFCLELPRYKRPRRLIFAPVPRNPTGKIEKPKLREQYCGVRLVEAQNQG